MGAVLVVAWCFLYVNAVCYSMFLPNLHGMCFYNVYQIVKFIQQTGSQNGGAEWYNNLRTGEYEMLYFNEYDPYQDILPGASAARAALTDSKLLYALSKFPEMYFEGGAMPVTMLGIDTADKGEITRIEQWFKQRATTLKNAFRVPDLEANLLM